MIKRFRSSFLNVLTRHELHFENTSGKDGQPNTFLRK